MKYLQSFEKFTGHSDDDEESKKQKSSYFKDYKGRLIKYKKNRTTWNPTKEEQDRYYKEDQKEK